MKFDSRGYVGLLLGLLLSVFLHKYKFYWSSLISLAVAVFVLIFHRDPNRKPPEDDGVVSPSDGVITDISEEDDYTEISVYLGLSDVHVFRSPTSSDIISCRCIDGGHTPAFIKSSEKNERLFYEFDDEVEIAVMTGFLARRLKSYKSKGAVSRCERLGIISFGSRVNTRIPNDKISELNAGVGDRVRAGETILAS